jgi:protein-S-isoprenylcysteine O-methyltransferase Ste14
MAAPAIVPMLIGRSAAKQSHGDDMTAAAKTSTIARRNLASRLQDVVLVVVTAFFFYAHASHVIVDQVYTSIPFALEQGLLVGIFLTRRRSQATSTHPMDWVFATLGGWLPLLFQVQGDATAFLGVAGTTLQVIGLGFALVGFLYLGRSFGIVAANRGLKINGPYRLVRHPIYSAHFITISGFLLANMSAINLAIYLVATSSQLMRIRAEERVLTDTADYATYRSRVRWRLMPGLF